MTAAGNTPHSLHRPREDVLVPLLEISTRQYRRHGLVALRGELDLAGAAEVRARLRTACEENEGRVILDLGELTFLDSTGLSILVEYHARTQSAGGRLVLLAPLPAVVRVLDITGLRNRLHVRARLDEIDEADEIEETGTGAPERSAEAEV